MVDYISKLYEFTIEMNWFSRNLLIKGSYMLNARGSNIISFVIA